MLFELFLTFSQISSFFSSCPNSLSPQTPPDLPLLSPFFVYFLYSSFPHKGAQIFLVHLLHPLPRKMRLTHSIYILIKTKACVTWTFLNKMKYQLVSQNLLPLTHTLRKNFYSTIVHLFKNLSFISSFLHSLTDSFARSLRNSSIKY